MKTIAILVPYFGKLPNYFRFWLESAAYNKDISFILITDSVITDKIPKNIVIKKMTFEEFKDKVQSKYNFNINLNTPYKMSDYKPAYGDIFSDLLTGYDYWGYCDIDMIFGDIRKFVTDEKLANNTRLFQFGHFSIFQNSAEINNSYKLPLKNKLMTYKKAFTTDIIVGFDEFFGINLIFEEYGLKVEPSTDLADIYFTKYAFYYESKFDRFKAVFLRKNGRMFAILSNGQIEEKLYIHLQKRKMDVKTKNVQKYYVVPNAFIDYSAIEKSKLNIYYKDKFYSSWYIRKFKAIPKNLKRKIFLKRNL
ncbi:DUF6625 family protein [Latilactobacillus sakei]|uniref:DUF6625 family protein n=1 Tax=Latilactobacillus sakei TaxID=1599 RepID=UPI0024DFDC09|nr:DUF6625 family protein [Latilactobacillus sakei]